MRYFDYYILTSSKLPEMAQRFMDFMGIYGDELKFFHLMPNPKGDYFKRWEGERGLYHRYIRHIEFFGNKLRPMVVIHELMHHYIYANDVSASALESISKQFINDFGHDKLTNYGFVCMTEAEGKYTELLNAPSIPHIYRYDNLDEEGKKLICNSRWEEVACEIIAIWGARGQYGLIYDYFKEIL